MKKLAKNMLLLIAVLFQLFTTAAYAEELPRFSSDQMNGKLSSTVYAMAKRCGMDVVFNLKSDAPVMATFTDKTLPEAMDLLSDANNLNWKIENNTLVVTPSDTMTQEKRFVLKYANPLNVKEVLKPYIPEKSIAINPEDSSITIDGTRAIVKKAEKQIKEMDVPVKMMLVQAQYVELSNSDALDLGFQHSWGVYDNKNFSKNLQYAVTADAQEILAKGKIVASPSVMTLNGQEAELKAGERVPVLLQTVATDGTKTTTVSYEPVGYFLKVTPRISGEDGNMITANLHPVASAITAWISNGNTKAPQISNREAITNVRVYSGQTIIIGGLVKDEEIANLQNVPGISNIPILGELFKHRHTEKNKTQVFIFVTLHILDSDGKPIINSTSKEPDKPAMTVPANDPVSKITIPAPVQVPEQNSVDNVNPQQ